MTFVLVLESHLCHKTGVLYGALVSMLRVCIDLRVVHFSGKAPRLAPAQLIAEQSAFKLEGRFYREMEPTESLSVF